MELKDYIKPKGISAALARALGVPRSLISQWASGARPVPEERAPAIEFHTAFTVRVESMCPDTRWQRVRHPAWPFGKPLIDKTPKRVRTRARVPNPQPSPPTPAAVADSQPESA